MRIWVTFPPEEPEEDPKDKLYPEGEYLCEIKAVDLQRSQMSKWSYLRWTLVPLGHVEPLFYITSLKPEALWALADFIEAVGGKRPWGHMRIEPDKYIGHMVNCQVTVQSYMPTLQAREPKWRNVIKAILVLPFRKAN